MVTCKQKIPKIKVLHELRNNTEWVPFSIEDCDDILLGRYHRRTKNVFKEVNKIPAQSYWTWPHYSHDYKVPVITLMSNGDYYQSVYSSQMIAIHYRPLRMLQTWDLHEFIKKHNLRCKFKYF